jgi:hypothetical protein
VLVFVDANNVRRSQWLNLSPDELVAKAQAWAGRHGHEVVLVFDGEAPDGAVGSGQKESADDWLIREVPAHPGAWLVTSDREVRGRAGTAAGRVIGGGSFLRMLDD